MPQVTGTYPDYQKRTLKSYFSLEGDKQFNPYTWSPPIVWEGTVGAHKVQFIQISSSGSNKPDYDWSDFPNELEVAITYIIEAIDKAMRVMD